MVVEGRNSRAVQTWGVIEQPERKPRAPLRPPLPSEPYGHRPVPRSPGGAAPRLPDAFVGGAFRATARGLDPWATDVPGTKLPARWTEQGFEVAPETFATWGE